MNQVPQESGSLRGFLLVSGCVLAAAAVSLTVTHWKGWVSAPLSEAERAIFTEDNVADFGGEAEARPTYTLRSITRDGDGWPVAVIATRGQARGYRAGSALPDGDTRVSRILGRAVLLERDGIYRLLVQAEAAEQQRAEKRPRASAPGAPSLEDRRADKASTLLASEYRERLYSDPLSLVGTIRVDVEQLEDGDRAYRIEPGRDETAFERFGLQPGDRVLAINGIDLHGADALNDVYAELATASHVAATLQRQGRPVVVLLALERARHGPE